ncbi:uncharacterized protein CXorf66 homolog [Arvicola amphibius]|uniref:uncharacterized protein CXorf66 homolog n=1 Tax=Arvicola amphibius TaxID=1047088 RepID=UPI0018E2C7CC|nr:uncharacterized protein CXorf66 homolog [Arvicola amphibius]
MKVHIYFLFLSIWTISCLNINHINESSTARTTGTFVKTTDSTGSKMDDFRKRLLGFIIGIMIITFTITCFCLLHYNCIIEEAQPPAARLNKENMEAISSWVSKVSACKPDIITEDFLETQPLLFNSDHITEPSCQENLSMPNCTIKPDEPSRLEKPCIPSNPQNSMRCTNTDESSMQCSIKTSNRHLDPKRSTKSLSPQRLHKPSILKSHKKHSLKKPQKLARTCKLASQVNSSCSEMQVTPPLLAIVKTSASLATQPCPSVPNNQLVSTKPSRRRPNQARGRRVLKKSVSTGKAVSRRKHSSFKCCRYQEKCLICNPEFLPNGLVGPKKAHAGNPYVLKTMKPLPRSFYEAEYKYTERGYKYKCYKANEGDKTTKTNESEDSGTEVVIICDRSHEDDDMAQSISTY